MTDLLVKLYELPVSDVDSRVRRARAPEREVVLDFVAREFGRGWRGECAVTFGGHPISCYIAEAEGQVVGFACYDATFRGFFGPVGVTESVRGNGLGTALTQACLGAMREAGYGYAVIGATKATDYYRKIAGAIEIPDSWPGAYTGLAKR